MHDNHVRMIEIDALKGFAMLLVVFGHAIIYFPVNLHENVICEWLFSFVSSVHMQLFFLLSGFVFSYRGDYAAYLMNKLRRILLPFLIFNLLDMIPRSLLGFLFNRPKSIAESLVHLVEAGGEFWFLYILFFIYLIFPFPAALRRKHRSWTPVIEGMLFILAVLSARIQFGSLGTFFYYIFFFYSGFVFREYYPALKEKMLRLHSAGLFLITAIPWILLFLFVRKTPLPWWFAQTVRILTAVAGIAACFSLALFPRFCRAFCRYGPWTLQLYLLNGWTLGVSRYLICNLIHSTSPALIIAWNTVADFELSYLLIKYCLSRFRPVRLVMGITQPPSAASEER